MTASAASVGRWSRLAQSRALTPGGSLAHRVRRESRSRPVEELAADAVRAVPDVRLEETELLVDLELHDQRLDLLLGQPGEHPHRLLVGYGDDVLGELGDLGDDLHGAGRLVVPDVDRVLLRLVEVSREGGVLLDELGAGEVADVDGEARRAPGGLPPEVDLLGEVDALA